MHDISTLQVGPYRFALLAPIVLFTVVEVVVSHRKKLNNYNWKESLANFSILIGLVISKLIFAGYQLWFFTFFSDFAWLTWPEGTVGYILAFIVVDFLIYCYHYISHKSKFFWSFHLVHHSSPWMNFTTAYRLNWMAGIISPIIFIPALLVGLPPTLVVISAMLNLFYQFFLHTELVGKLGWIEKVFNTPSNHRVHHGTNPKYIDKNFGGVLMIWDRIFGTYMEEEEMPTYGVTTGFEGHNPFRLVFHGFVDYFRGRLDSKG